MSQVDAAELAAQQEASSPLPGSGPSESEMTLVEFAQLWARGFVDGGRLWSLFDVCEMFLYRPDYFGAPVFDVGGQLVSPVFSSLNLLTEFMTVSRMLGPENGAETFDWVRVTGVQFFGLPVRARYLQIDPGSTHSAVVDLGPRVDPPPLANGAPPLAVNLELGGDGKITGGQGVLPDGFQEFREAAG